jgi:hypothetical protein
MQNPPTDLEPRLTCRSKGWARRQHDIAEEQREGGICEDGDKCNGTESRSDGKCVADPLLGHRSSRVTGLRVSQVFAGDTVAFEDEARTERHRRRREP